MSRFRERYYNPNLRWPDNEVLKWDKKQLPRNKLADIMEDLRVVDAALKNTERAKNITDRRQLMQAATMLNTLRSLWLSLLPGEPAPILHGRISKGIWLAAEAFNTREWTFTKERAAALHRDQYVTVGIQIQELTGKQMSRWVNRIATYYDTEIRSLREIRGGQS